MEDMEEICKTDLKNLLSPFSYSDVYQRSTADPGRRRINSGIHYRARIASSCDWGWEYNSNVVRMISINGVFGDPEVTNTSGKAAAGVCEEVYQFQPGMFITCSVELKAMKKNTATVVLGFNIQNRHGALVIFDPVLGKPVKFISVPEPVRSVTVISHNEEDEDSRPYFNEAMMAMVGILGVGLDGGGTLILDLGLDDPFLSCSRSQWIKYPNVMVERPHKLKIVTPHQSNIATERHHAVQQKQLISLLISSCHSRENEDESNFNYKSESGELFQIYEKRDVNVCAVDYAPALGALIIGFNFGGFQLWRVDNLTLLYTCPLLEISLEISGFSLAMPVDDPKNFVYLWVLYGKEGAEFGYSHISLYSFGFRRAHSLDNFGLVYDDFDRKCAYKRLTIHLEDVFAHEEEDMEEDFESLKRFVRPLRIWTDPIRRLTFVCWEVNRNGVYYVGIFDMDSWYSNRALDFLRYDTETSLCPYWVAIPIEHIELDTCYVWDSVVPLHSIERWQGLHTKHDVHSYPASLSFQGISLTNHGSITWQHWGVQEKFVRKLDEDGPSLMVNPRTICTLLQAHGVCPAYPLEFDSTVSREVQDRFCILTSLLDCGRRATLTQLAQAWFDGSYANVGCSINLLVEWISSLTCCINTKAKEHWRILFDCRNDGLPRDSATFLHYSYYVWTNLRSFLTTLMRPEQVRHSFAGTYVEDLDYALEKMISYSSALLLLHTANIIPVQDQFDILKIIGASHKARRAHVTQALADCNLLDKEQRSIRPMMIDHLLARFPDDVIRSQWNIERDEEDLYPPKSFAYILGMLMWPHDEPAEVYRVVRYFLQDVQDVLIKNKRNLLGTDLYTVTPLSIVDYEDVDFLWKFDHGFVKAPMMLLSGRGSGIKENYKLPWIPCIIVSAALNQLSEVKSVLSQACPPSLIKLHFKIQLADVTSFSTLCDSISVLKDRNKDDVLNSFFEVLEESGNVQRFIQEKLTNSSTWMQEGLINYLKKQQTSFDRDMQLLFVYSTMENISKIEEQRELILNSYDTEALDKEQFIDWTRLSELISNIIQQAKFKNPLQFVFNETKTTERKPERKIWKLKPRKVSISFGDKLGNLPKLPPQLQRLRANEKQPGPLSPLRKYAARIASFMETPQKSRASISKQSSRLRMSINRSMSKFFDDEDIEEDSTEKPPDSKLDNSCINLLELLELPVVDHRQASVSTIDSQAETSETPHSIMRIRGKSPRKNLPVSFVNVTPPKVETILEEQEISKDSEVEEDSANITMSEIMSDEPVSRVATLDPLDELLKVVEDRERSVPEAMILNSTSASDTTDEKSPSSRGRRNEVSEVFEEPSATIENAEVARSNEEGIEEQPTVFENSVMLDASSANITLPEIVPTEKEVSATATTHEPPAVDPTEASISAVDIQAETLETPHSKMRIKEKSPRKNLPVSFVSVTPPKVEAILEEQEISKDLEVEEDSANITMPEIMSDELVTKVSTLDPLVPFDELLTGVEDRERSVPKPMMFNSSITSDIRDKKPPSSRGRRKKSVSDEPSTTIINAEVTPLTDKFSEEKETAFENSLVLDASSADIILPEIVPTESEVIPSASTPGPAAVDPTQPSASASPVSIQVEKSETVHSLTRKRKKSELKDAEDEPANRITTRARSKTPVKAFPTPEEPSIKSPARSKSKSTSSPESSSSSSARPLRTRKKRISDFSPELSTVVEDKERSVPEATILNYTITSEITDKKSPSSKGRRKKSVSETSMEPLETVKNTEVAPSKENIEEKETIFEDSLVLDASSADITLPEIVPTEKEASPTASTHTESPGADSKQPSASPVNIQVEKSGTGHSGTGKRRKSERKETEEEPANRITTRARSKTPVKLFPTPEEPSNKSPGRSKSKSTSSPESSSSSSSRALRTRRKRVFDFAPELSTVAEDSERSVSVLEATILDSTITSDATEKKPPASKGRRKKSLSEISEYDADDDNSEVVERAPKRNRRCRSVTPLESEDAESDTSSVRTTRSSSRRKTPSASQKRKI